MRDPELARAGRLLAGALPLGWRVVRLKRDAGMICAAVEGLGSVQGVCDCVNPMCLRPVWEPGVVSVAASAATPEAVARDALRRVTIGALPAGEA